MISPPQVPAIRDSLPDALWVRSATVTSAQPLEVAIGGVTYPAQSWMGGWRHVPGDRVWAARTGNSGMIDVLGSQGSRPTTGVVSSTTSTTVTVTDSQGRVMPNLPYVGARPSTSDLVGLVWGADGGFVAGVLATSATAPPDTNSSSDPDAPDTPAGSSYGQVSAAAAWMGTARSGSWRADKTGTMLQGHWRTGISDDNTGVATYGRALTAADATPTGPGTIRLKRDSKTGLSGPVAVQLTLHSYHSKPSSPPPWIDGPTQVGTLRWGQGDVFTLPAGWAQQLLDGSAGGVGIDTPGTGDYAAILGPGSDASAGLITIPYVRS